MKVFLTGGLGFVGRHLTQYLLSRGHQVSAVGRRPNPPAPRHPDFSYVAGDTTRSGDWQRVAKDHQVFVNLAGRSIFTRWDEKTRQEILESRLLTTRRLVEALPEGAGTILCSASAVGYYGDRGDALLTEEAPCGSDFLAEVARKWEGEALAAREKGTRVALMRFGIVLERDGGAFALMHRAFKWGLGGPLGGGRQWFPWIQMQDLLAAVDFVIAGPALQGPFNFCAPQPVRNQTLTRELAQRVHRPAFMPAPAFMIRLVLGEFGQALLDSQRAVPAKLQQHGFTFAHPSIESALDAMIP